MADNRKEPKRPVLSPDAVPDRVSRSDGSRRRLLKGAAAIPAIYTLHSGAARAQVGSILQCVANTNGAPNRNPVRDSATETIIQNGKTIRVYDEAFDSPPGTTNTEKWVVDELNAVSSGVIAVQELTPVTSVGDYLDSNGQEWALVPGSEKPIVLDTTSGNYVDGIVGATPYVELTSPTLTTPTAVWYEQDTTRWVQLATTPEAMYPVFYIDENGNMACDPNDPSCNFALASCWTSMPSP